ncbi:tetratricopeptide repeat protein [Nocardia sp. NPDC101769]|uniref:tetratricopeptide repeat protein n=1 Tax=Nocardia sp. NPDC101769 TaxID=3364333 RepID=UPI0038146DCA
MAYRVADTFQRWVRDPEIMTTVVAVLRPWASVLPGLGPDFASALRLRALALSVEYRYDDALIDVEEALRICRRAPIVRRTTTEVQIATALSLRAYLLRCVGREREAVDDAREALALCRERLSRAPHRFGPSLLSSLDELARSLDRTGEPGQALPFGEELVDILRRLAPRRPRYERFLASALHQLGGYISDAGDLTDALRVANESLQLYRRLGREQPEAFALQAELATHNRDLFLDRLHQQG